MVSTIVLSCPGLPAAFTREAKAVTKRFAITDLGVLNLHKRGSSVGEDGRVRQVHSSPCVSDKAQALEAWRGLENGRINGLACSLFAAHRRKEGCP